MRTLLIALTSILIFWALSKVWRTFMYTGPEPNHFGLAEAKASANYITTRAEAQVVMGVVCGALKFKNVVAEDVAEEIQVYESDATDRDEEMAANLSEMDRLSQENALLKAMNAADEAVAADLRRIAELFGG
ncbi:MAG: hypothetical protein Q7R91_02865 [bacterium]|nr:hypothetical protein [bacterium]